MKQPSAELERRLIGRGYNRIVGIDEVGRGALAGPVVAACLEFNRSFSQLPKINDSKLLSPGRREEIFDWLAGQDFCYGLGVVAQQVIDAIGIFPAVKLAMKQAIENLAEQPEYLLIDALELEDFPKIPQQGIIKGDQKIWSIAAASIIAKVSRDRIMNHYHQSYQVYGFDRHKGYGTEFHRKMIAKHGISPIHRKSYRLTGAVD